MAEVSIGLFTALVLALFIGWAFAAVWVAVRTWIKPL